MKAKMDAVALLFGNAILKGFSDVGGMGRFLFHALISRPKISNVLEQMMGLGVSSMPIVLLAAVFTGFIATWQVKYLAGDLMGLQYLGMMVIKVVFSELGPTLIGLMLAGRIGAKVAAEVGTMRVTEQIDAMICLSLNPVKYFIAPRILAGFIMTPILFIYASLAAIVSAQLLATFALGLHAGTYYNSMKLMFYMNDLNMGLVKSFVFGGITAITGTYFGYYTTGGAVGVGSSTRNAVVSASILILIFNVLINQMMM